MSTVIRNAKESEYRLTEEIIREAFWNNFQPGADEHFVLHNLRTSADSIQELDLVAEVDGRIVGSIVYSKSVIDNDHGLRKDVITFGPVGILPEYQKRGLGEQLIKESILKATGLGYPAILIYGDPRYYHKFGFRCAEKFDITREDGKYAVALMALPLKENALANASGRFVESESFKYAEKDLERFEENFVRKEKGYSKTQDVFLILSSLAY